MMSDELYYGGPKCGYKPGDGAIWCRRMGSAHTKREEADIGAGFALLVVAGTFFVTFRPTNGTPLEVINFCPFCGGRLTEEVAR